MSLYTDKLQGSLLAAALGDALGSFGECMHYRTVDRKYSALPPRRYRGRIPYSDDTALRLVLYDTIISSGLNAFNFANYWKRKVVDNRIYWTSELYVTSMILMGEDAHRIGHGNMLGDNAAMAADPIGMLYPGFDELAALRAFETMSVCQSGKGLEGAMAVAAAVSKACTPRTDLDEVVDSSRRWVSRAVRRRIDNAVAIASSTGDPRRRLYDAAIVEDGLTDQIRSEIDSVRPVESARRLLNLELRDQDISMGISPLEVVPIAIGYAARGRKKPLSAIVEAARFGRDCDTISGIAGAILGAINGRSLLPTNYLRLLPNELLATARRIAPRMATEAKQTLRSVSQSKVGKELFS